MGVWVGRGRATRSKGDVTGEVTRGREPQAERKPVSLGNVLSSSEPQGSGGSPGLPAAPGVQSVWRTAGIACSLATLSWGEPPPDQRWPLRLGYSADVWEMHEEVETLWLSLTSPRLGAHWQFMSLQL